MVSSSSLRTKIEQRIFTADIKSTALVSSLAAPSQNKWGDETTTYATGTSIDVVPFVYAKDTLNYQPFGGAAQEGEVDFVVKYSVTVTANDLITWQGQSYLITAVDDSAFLGNALVVRVIRCRRVA